MLYSGKVHMAFSGRLGIQQRVLPVYRAAFFDLLGEACPGGLSVFAGQPRRQEAIEIARGLRAAQWVPADNRHLFGGSLYLCWQCGLSKWLEDWDPQALVVEANPRYLSTPQALRWMKTRRRPVIGWGLGSPAIQGSFAAARQQSRRNFIRQFNGLITYSQRGAEEYRELGFPPARIWVAPNAVTHCPSWSLPFRPSNFTGAPVVLFVGRLQARKRVENLLGACAALPEALKPRLVIVGDGPERANLEELAKTLYPSAEFPGAYHGSDLEPFFTIADLFVLPGTGGLAIQEAMAYGLPVIASEADGTQADLVRPENGWQAQPGSVGSLAAAMKTALADPSRLRQMGAASYQIVAKEINLEAMVSVFLDAISTCQDLK